MIVLIHLNQIIICVIAPNIREIRSFLCSKDRRELLKMVVMRMLMPTAIIEKSELDIFTENPNPCPF